MKIAPFFTERYFALHEFTAPYPLCLSDCESVTVEELLQVAGVTMQALAGLWLGYTESQGAPDLREQIAARYRQVDAGQVIGVSAPEEGIFLTLHALLEPGDRVVVLSPCYDSLANLAGYLGCEVVRWWLVEAEEPPAGPGGWQLGTPGSHPSEPGLDALDRLVTPSTRLVIVNFPHNPTGTLPTPAQWQVIVDIAARAGTWLFSDEMYRGLELDPAMRLPPACDLYERAVTLGGLSKTYGLPGLRTGWLALQDRVLRDRIQTWRDYTTICASAPSERLAHIALQAGDALIDRNRQIVRDNLALAQPFFDRWPDLFRWNPPQAGPVALAGLRRGSAQAFCERLVAEAGVLLLPSTGLGFGDRHVRFGFGRRSFPAALHQLDRYLAQGGAAVV